MYINRNIWKGAFTFIILHGLNIYNEHMLMHFTIFGDFKFKKE